MSRDDDAVVGEKVRRERRWTLAGDKPAREPLTFEISSHPLFFASFVAA